MMNFFQFLLFFNSFSKHLLVTKITDFPVIWAMRKEEEVSLTCYSTGKLFKFTLAHLQSLFSKDLYLNWKLKKKAMQQNRWPCTKSQQQDSLYYSSIGEIIANEQLSK